MPDAAALPSSLLISIMKRARSSFSAGELVGAAYIQMNRGELAQKLFSQMSIDDGVPESIRKRAGDMAAALGANRMLLVGVAALALSGCAALKGGH
eukprot:gene68988-94545_t